MCMTEQGKIKIEDKQHLLRLLHALVADEHKAASEYTQVLSSLDGTDFPKEISEALKEIHKDELNHIGSLLSCMTMLSDGVANDIVEGMQGE